MTGSVCLASASMGASVAWVVPTYRNARPVWRFAESHLTGKIAINRSDMTASFPGGGWLGVYTAENPVGILGEAFDLVVVEEAARIPPNVWAETIMPTLADRDGRAYLISTPKGKNWFYEEFMRGRMDGKTQAAFTAPSIANPMPTIQRAAALARERVSERTYRQEWLAEFVDDGALFLNVEACAIAERKAPEAGADYVIGVDWARASDGDYTVFVVLDAERREMVEMVRMAGAAFDAQMRRLRELSALYNHAYIVAEKNSMGAPLIEALQLEGVPVDGFVTTAASKHQIISALELAFDRREIKVLNDPALILELNAFEKHERTGLPHYGAPAGMHDDTVIALALAWYAATGAANWLVT